MSQLLQRPRRVQTHLLQAYPYQLHSQSRYHILQLFEEQEHYYAHILLHLLELMAKLQIRPAAQQQQLLLLLILHLQETQQQIVLQVVCVLNKSLHHVQWEQKVAVARLMILLFVNASMENGFVEILMHA